ncbi:N-lysine methyltransferase SMYD2 [Grifola frondosa]|uniref:N-lysine methyltransferase SMYD2 n=1 Tax=Grifola frondosa TaxID=5627 RepID=A0A1C7MKK2_GRIFR|nr:N-lysine methyltransferase SMYD2 [Grifola frondosa]
MAFHSLKSSRKAKETRSFVTAQSTPSGESHSINANHAYDEGDLISATEETELVPLNGLYERLSSLALEVRKSSQYGRGIYSKLDAKAGSILISIKPNVSVLSASCLSSYCSSCCGPALDSGLKRCTRCRTVWYCNAICQNRDWPIHKLECDALQKWALNAPSHDVSVPSDAVRCLGRILWSEQKEGLGSNFTKEINLMQSRKLYFGNCRKLTSAGDLVDLISRFTTNTFTLTSHTLTPIGICVCPTIAFTNHSCDPNAVIVFPRASSDASVQEPLLNLVSIKDIKPNEEVRISYIDTTLPKELRKKDLKETYNFTSLKRMSIREFLCGALNLVAVNAQYPQKVANSIRLNGMAHSFCVCLLENAMTRCTQCKTAVTSVDSVLDALRVGQEAFDKVTLLQSKDPKKAKHITTNMLPILTSAGLTPSCHPLLALTRLHLELLIASLSSALTQDCLDETIRTAGMYSAGLTLLLPKGHPVRGIALGELGKLLAVDEPSPATDPSKDSTKFPPSGPPRLKLAYEYLVRAYDELIIGFGRQNGGGQVGSQIREAIVRLEKELGVWTHGIQNVLEDTRAVESRGPKE